MIAASATLACISLLFISTRCRAHKLRCRRRRTAAPCILRRLQRRTESLPSSAGGLSSSMSWVAGIVVVGDEMLSGKVEDSNTPFLCSRLHEIGWTVRKVTCVLFVGGGGAAVQCALPVAAALHMLRTRSLPSLLQIRARSLNFRVASLSAARLAHPATLCCPAPTIASPAVPPTQVVLVPDDVAAIASEVAALSASCQAVITSGGVGPTLDDVTMEGISAAFGADLIRCAAAAVGAVVLRHY